MAKNLIIIVCAVTGTAIGNEIARAGPFWDGVDNLIQNVVESGTISVEPPRSQMVQMDYLRDYNRGGGITQEQARNLRHYAKNQPAPAMRKLLGYPNRISDRRDSYRILGTGDQAYAGQQLIVDYQEVNGQQQAINWRVEGTISPDSIAARSANPVPQPVAPMPQPAPVPQPAPPTDTASPYKIVPVPTLPPTNQEEISYRPRYRYEPVSAHGNVIVRRKVRIR